MYVKLFQDLLDSTIWMEKDHVVRVWLTLLLLADSEGFVEIPIPALAQRARVGLDECAEAIERLESPDPYSRTGVEEGRRLIRPTTEKTLWQITNYEYYRSMKSIKQKREYQKRYMREWRRKRNGPDSRSEKSDSKLSQSEKKVHELAQAEAEAYKEKTTSSSSSRGDDSAFINWVLEFWNAHDLKPSMKSISKQRRSSILARRREHGDEAVKEVLGSRRDSNFLCNVIFDGRGAPVDWVFGPKNFAKVLDGNYDNVRKGGKRGGGQHGEYDGKL
jgi:hypothetical protein